MNLAQLAHRVELLTEKARQLIAPSPGQKAAPPRVPAALPVLGCALEFGRDAGAFLHRCQQRYGDTFTVPVAGKRMTFALNPHDAPSVFKNTEALSFAPIVVDMTRRVFGISPQGAKLAGEPVVHEPYKAIKAAELPALNKVMQGKLEGWLDATVRPDFAEDGLYRFVYRAMFAVTCATIFGDEIYSDEMMEVFQGFDDRFALLAAGVPAVLLPGVARQRSFLAQRLAVLRPDASRIHRERDALFRSRVSDQDRCKNHVGLLWAAQANTIPAAFWSVVFLLANPAARRAVTAELQAVSAEFGPPAAGNERFAELGVKKLALLESSIMEALRLRTGSMTLREVKKPFTLESAAGPHYALDCGDYLCLFPYIAHHDPEIFENPDQYQFDRFHSPDGPQRFCKSGKRLSHPLMLFGGGVSMCPGRFMALAEIKLFIAFLLSRCELELQGSVVPQPDLRRAGLGVLTPKSDLRLRYRAISPS